MNYQLWNVIDVSSIFGDRFNRINIFYSNPDYYTQQKRPKAKNQDSIKWPVKTDDFFPYSDCPHCFWTGYFTSRSALKRFERVASSFLLAARQIDANVPISHLEKLAVSNSPNYSWSSALYPLEDAVSIAQHHDAVAGTAKQHVADDYSKKLSYGVTLAAQHMIYLLKRLLFNTDGDIDPLENLNYCPLLNETICEISVVSRTSVIFYTIFPFNTVAYTNLLLILNYLLRRKPLQRMIRLCSLLFTTHFPRIDRPLFAYQWQAKVYFELNVLMTERNIFSSVLCRLIHIML
jgi:hypothetical protein